MTDDVDRLPCDDVACALGGHKGCAPLLSACDDLPRAVSLRELSRDIGCPSHREEFTMLRDPCLMCGRLDCPDTILRAALANLEGGA